MTTLNTENFDRAGEVTDYVHRATLQLLAGTGTYSYVNGVAFVKSAGAYACITDRAVTPPSPNYWVAADVKVNTIISGHSAGVLLRGSATEKKAYYLQLYADGTLKLQRDGPWNGNLATASVPLTEGTTYHVEGVIDGDQIWGYVDGVLKIGPITDNAITEAGFPGYVVWADTAGASTTTGLVIDNLSFGTLSSGDTINCSLGSASASGFSASISSAISIACALGIATASGHQATITSSSNLEISCSLGTAAASGFNASIAAGGSATITSSVFKNNTGIVLASLTIQKAWAIPFGSPDFVNVVTDASGVLTITDGSLSPGDYLLVLSNADGSAVGVKKYTAV